MPSSSSNLLVYDGSDSFRMRLIMSTLSGRPVKLKHFRDKGNEVGVRGYEAGFIRLLDKLSNGTTIEVNETGTTIYYAPGLLIGGAIDHDCDPARGIGYSLEALVCLAPFCKRPVTATLRGVTNENLDPTVDGVRATTLPLLKHFGFGYEGLEIKIIKRGAPPSGGGEIRFSCPTTRIVRPVRLTGQGRVKRVRGVAYTTRVSPTVGNRMVDAAKAVLSRFVRDVFVTTDHAKGVQSGLSSGFGLTLVAETTTGVLYSVAVCSEVWRGVGKTGSSGADRETGLRGADKETGSRGADRETGSRGADKETGSLVTDAETGSLRTHHGVSAPDCTPDDLGSDCAYQLIDEIYRGGCVDARNQSTALLFMSLTQQNVSTVVTGQLSPYTMRFMRHLKDFFGVKFKIDIIRANDDDGGSVTGDDKVQLSCMGIGFSNLSKTVS